MAGEDNFFDTPSFRKRRHWVLIAVAAMTLLALGLPLVSAFTSWL